MSAIVAERLEAGTRLPPIRQLAGDLGLAANTVAKAYKDLEADGFVASNGRRGTVVLAPSAAAPEPVAQRAADEFAATIRRLGLDPATALSMVTDALAR
ncbi:MAG: GntR family transcriptional regulator [Actinomycetota bacterium]